MSITPPALPAPYSWGFVVGQVIHAIADTTADADRLPQARAATGTVRFEPLEMLRKVTAEPTAFVAHAVVTATLGTTGELVDAEGQVGIWLVTGDYRVSFAITGAAIPSFNITVTAAHTLVAPLDLVTVSPYTPPSGTTVTTMLVPSGATVGDVLTWTAGGLAWGAGGTGGTGGGVSEVSGTVTLPADGPRVVQMYTTASTVINGETFPVDTALVARRTAAGVWQVAVVDSADWRAFVASPAPDATAPTVPTGLSATAAGSTSVNLAWTASTDAVGVTGYEYRVGGGAAVDAGAGLTETVLGLTASTLYSFQVRAYDAAGNRSGWSTAASATTAAATPGVAELYAAVMALSPIGYWKLDETTGTTAIDSSGNGRNGTYAGTHTLAARDGYATFAGGSVTIPDDDVFSVAVSGELTVFACFRLDANNNVLRAIASKAGGGSFEWALCATDTTGGDGFTGVVWNTEAMDFQRERSVIPSAAAWHAAAMVATNVVSARTPLYLDSGTALATTQGPGTGGTIVNTTAPLNLGARFAGNGTLTGALAHVAIFDGALTAAQIGGLINAARGAGLAV